MLRWQAIRSLMKRFCIPGCASYHRWFFRAIPQHPLPLDGLHHMGSLTCCLLVEKEKHYGTAEISSGCALPVLSLPRGPSATPWTKCTALNLTGLLQHCSIPWPLQGHRCQALEVSSLWILFIWVPSRICFPGGILMDLGIIFPWLPCEIIFLFKK